MADPSQEKRFYSPRQITWAAFLGGPLAGFWFISRNFLFVGEHEKAKMAVVNGIALSFILGAVIYALTKIFPHFPNDVMPLAYSGALGAYAKNAAPSLLTADISLKGLSWRVSGLSLLFMIPTAVLIVIPIICGDMLTANN